MRCLFVTTALMLPLCGLAKEQKLDSTGRAHSETLKWGYEVTEARFREMQRNYRPEHFGMLLDAIEARQRPILAKEISDLLNAKRLLLSSTFPLLVVAVGIARLSDRIPGYSVFNWIGAALIFILAICAPLISRRIHNLVRQISTTLPKK